ncbi:receptor-like kinase TMK4 [Alnus glutinosa]|uniref:receptor-like kinase TMK4 n=1 Tax=Alnus glutinosa TaxID=3517 RepID=UPI002D768751|nr:receptor-like kinase TMK4 [Alnus glutinosa]
MGHSRTLLCLSTFILLALSSFTAADDAAVMAELLAALSPVPSGWSASTAPCQWKNVSCNSNDRVTSIVLVSKNLSGTLPSNLGSLTQLISLSLQGNYFSGPLPSLANLSSLQQLYLDNNNFNSIPAGFFQGLKSLKFLFLSSNSNLSPWTIPTELNQATSLVTLAAGTSNLVGPLPDIFDSFPNLKVLDLAFNDLTGPLPKSFGGSGIQNLSLNNQVNGLSGTIDVLSSMTQLNQVWLQENQFTGPIPDLSSLPGLQVLDVSNNNFTGSIPKFASTVKFTATGNPLLGTTTPSSGNGGTSSGSNGTTPSGSPAGTGSGGSSVSTGMIAGIVIAVVIFVVVLLFVWIKCYVGRGHRKFGRVENTENGKEVVKNGIIGGDLPVFEGGNVAISIQVLRQVTNNFSEDNILGSGGSGVVYKGELHDGTKIAVKRMESVAMGSKGMKEFQAEIAVLTKVRHRHLVALLGSCVNGNERFLVFEYMPQGTLTQHLFYWPENGCSPLTWKQRVTIALDVGRGVEYLHSLAQQSFIHRDLKPSNILLGDDMRAKVSDFGLVKNVPDGKDSVETRLAGTFGYLPPEYAATGRVTTKVDVYAYGVVLMELITGRKALDDSVLDDWSDMVTWFRSVLINRENIPKAIDQTLNPDEETMESIYKVAELAGHCTAREPYQRPDMGHAVSILSPLVEQWKPSSQEAEESNGIDLDMTLPQALTASLCNVNNNYNSQSFCNINNKYYSQ